MNMYSAKRQFGNIGEEFVVKDLESKRYEIIARNYLKKWGEIDIVAFKNDILHFVEVKTVSWKGEGQQATGHRPEENMHVDKIRRLQRTAQTFLGEHTRIYHDTDWQIDLACVYLENDQVKKIEYIENIII
jgi:putative endonuclease